MSELDRSDEIHLDRFNIRYIAFGGLLIFLTLFAAEKLIWKAVSDDSRTFFNQAISRVSAVDISPDEKDAIRLETLQRLSVPPVLGIGVFVLIAPLGVGILVGWRSRSHFSAFWSVLLGSWVALATSQSFSFGAIVASLLYASVSIPGSIGIRKVQKWRKQK
jgi:hypothetical protein